MKQKHLPRSKIQNLTFNTFLFFVVITISSYSSDIPQELFDCIDAFYTAIDKDDVDARIDLLAYDIIMMPNHWTSTYGKERVAESLRKSAHYTFKLKNRELVRIEMNGELAYTVNSYYYTYHAANDVEQWRKTKNVHIWRRDSKGHWKLLIDIWNSDVPIDKFENE